MHLHAVSQRMQKPALYQGLRDAGHVRRRERLLRAEQVRKIMAREFAKDFYKSQTWIKTRAAFLNSKMHICERCENRNGIGNIVHHKIYITEDNIDDPGITLNWDNFECLCQTCHNREHHREEDEATAGGLMFDASGQLKRIPP